LPPPPRLQQIAIARSPPYFAKDHDEAVNTICAASVWPLPPLPVQGIVSRDVAVADHPQRRSRARTPAR
jgi:hypothetical protein